MNLTTAPAKRATRLQWKALLWLLALAPGCLLLLLILWPMAALYFDVRISWLRAPLALGYAAVLLAMWVLTKRRWLKVALTAGGFVLVLGWWLLLPPSNNRNWQPDVAVLGYAEINENKVTLHNIRNCDYRTETDFEVRHYDQTFNLDKLRTADLYMVYWGSPYMAHTMVSFGFDNDDYVCFSIETRKEVGEGYSALKGFFRQFELIYVVADERDVVRLRTNYRQGEEAYLYRLTATPEQVRTLFLDYVRRLNRLHEQPEWYNALTQNCTTSIRMQQDTTTRAPWDWRMLVNGYGDRMLYQRGQISTNLPFAELKERAHINARAKTAGDAKSFSRLIRQAES